MANERLIKRYTNRKLYDTQQSRYVTLDDIARLVRDGEEVRVIDNDSQQDLTSVTFAQIILEEEKRKTNLVSVAFLRKLIRSGEATMQDISDRATQMLDDLRGKGRSGEEAGGRAGEEGRSFIDELFHLPQKRLDDLREAARKQVDSIRQSATVQKEIERIEKSIHSLEKMVARLRTQEAEHAGEPRVPPAADPGMNGAGPIEGPLDDEEMAGVEPTAPREPHDGGDEESQKS